MAEKKEKKKKVLEQINDRFEDMANRWARGNAHGIPISHQMEEFELAEQVNIAMSKLE